MAHEIAQAVSGAYQAAFFGGAASTWHKLGGTILPGMTEQDMLAAASIDFELVKCPITYDFQGVMLPDSDSVIVARSDTGDRLGVVGSKFQLTQPNEGLSFVNRIAGQYGLQMDAIMALKGGAVLVFAAKLPDSGVEIVPGDVSNGFFVFAVGCDGSLQRTAWFSETRVVCSNTLRISLRDSNGKKANKVTQKQKAIFDPDLLAQKMGIILDSRQSTIETLRTMAQVEMATVEAQALFCRLLGKPIGEREKKKNEVVISRPERTLLEMFMGFEGNGRVPGYEFAPGTAYTGLNAVTRYYDHVPTGNKNGSDARRAENALFGMASAAKDKAFELFSDFAENKGDNAFAELIRTDAKLLTV